MALPGTDPYCDSAPSITSVSESLGIVTITGTGLSAWARVELDVSGAGTDVREAVRVKELSGSSTSFLHAHTNLEVYSWGGVPSPTTGDDITVYQPVQFTRQNPCYILQSTAFYYCGIDEAFIDTTTIAAVATSIGSSYPRTVALFDKSCLEILVKMFEETGVVYMFVDGQARLSVGELDDPPTSCSTSSWSGNIDYQLEEDEFEVISLERIVNGRAVPGRLRWGYDEDDLINFDIQDPSKAFPAHQDEWSAPVGLADWGIPDAMKLDSEYDAYHVDDGGDDPGDYAVMSEYIKLVIRIDGRGAAMDIGETLRPLSASLGLDASDSQDTFVIHEVEFDPMTFYSKLTLLKKATWTTQPI